MIVRCIFIPQVAPAVSCNVAVSISVMTREGAQNLLVSCPFGPRHPQTDIIPGRWQ